MDVAAATLNGAIYIFGGRGYSSGGWTEALCLQPGRGDLPYVQHLPEPRWGHCAVPLDGAIYILGGTGPNGVAAACWRLQPSAPGPPMGHGKAGS
jgi:hypothetical protein